MFTVYVKDTAGKEMESNSVTVNCKDVVNRIDVTISKVPRPDEDMSTENLVKVTNNLNCEFAECDVFWVLRDEADQIEYADSTTFIDGKYYELFCSILLKPQYIYDTENMTVTINGQEATIDDISYNGCWFYSEFKCEKEYALGAGLVVNKSDYTEVGYKGGEVVLDVNVHGGTEPYKYLMRTSEDGKDIVLKDFSSDASYTGPLMSYGTKIFTAVVKDFTGKTVKTQSVKITVVDYPPIKSYLTAGGCSTDGHIKVGENIILKPYAQGGARDYQYQYVMKNVDTGKTIILKDYCSESKYTGQITSAGTKVFMVNIKDRLGKSVTTNSVIVYADKDTADSSAMPLKALIKVNGVPGTISSFENYHTQIWTMSSSLGYIQYRANVKDNQEDVVSTNTVKVISSNGDFESTLTLNGEKDIVYLKKGQTINLEAGIGGKTAPAGYTYQYVMYNENTMQEIVLKDFCMNKNYTGTITSVGAKIFTVNIKNANGDIITSNAIRVVVS